MRGLIIFLSVFLFAFDEKLYEYMYKTFVYSNDIKDAYIVAKKVLEINPDSIVWKERLARVAWALGKNKEAYNNFLDIYKKTHSKKIREILFLFPYEKSIELKKRMYEKEIKNGNFSHVIELANIYIKFGYPEKAYEILKKGYIFFKRDDILKELIKVSISLDNIVDVIKYFNKIKNFPLEMRIEIAKELVYFNRYDFAFDLLKDVEKLPKNMEYYKYMVYITYKLREIKKMMLLLDYLLYEGKLKGYELNILTNYYLHLKKYEFLEFLFERALKNNKSYIYSYIEVLKLQKKYKKLVHILKLYKEFLNKKYYLYNLGYVYWRLGDINKAHIYFIELVKNFKLNNIEISSILWFVINTKDSKLFKYIEPLIKNNRNFYYQLMLVYFNLNEIDKAYYKALSILDNNLDNIDFLLTFSDILDAMGRESYFYKFRAWKILNKKLNANHNLLKDREFFKNYFRLAIYFLDGNKVVKLLDIGKKILSKKEYLTLEISYYFNVNLDRSIYIYNYKRSF